MNTATMLEEMGHRVYEATGAKSALQVIEANPEIDLVITDHAMPGMTGVQLADAIHQRRPGLPIVLATGYAELPVGSATELPRLGKPFSEHDLARAVQAAVSESVS
jgi:CheY-like chemotaxis protein